MKKLSIKLLLALCLFAAVERFCHKQTEGFRLAKIFSDLPYRDDWAIKAPENFENIKAILSQPFHYLGSGGQCYAFLSEDKDYVLKVFKHHHMRPKSWINALPLPHTFQPLKQKIITGRQKRLDRIFGSVKIAYDHFQNQTGLIYIHLNKSDTINQKITLYDPLNIAHKIDLDKVEFALQKKAQMAYPTLSKLIEEGKRKETEIHLTALLDLIFERCQAGILDHDPIMKRNFGFVGSQAIEIDLGSFTLDDYLKGEKQCRRTLFFQTMKIRRWVKKKYPDYSSFLEEEIAQRLEQDLVYTHESKL